MRALGRTVVPALSPAEFGCPGGAGQAVASVVLADIRRCCTVRQRKAVAVRLVVTAPGERRILRIPGCQHIRQEIQNLLL